MVSNKKEAKQTLDGSVSAFLKGKGLARTDQPPDDTRQMPVDPTRLNSRDLQRTYTAMVAWYSYTNDALAQTRVQVLEAERKLRLAKAIYRQTAKTKAKWRIDDDMFLDKKIRKLERIHDKYLARQIALEAMVMNYDKKSAAMSRDQTRREVEFKKGGRLQ